MARGATGHAHEAELQLQRCDATVYGHRAPRIVVVTGRERDGPLTIEPGRTEVLAARTSSEAGE